MTLLLRAISEDPARDHWRAARVNGLDGVAAIDALQIDRRDDEVAWPSCL
jgi:hypothetical protein